MPSAATLAAFCAATLLVLVVPGPSVVFVVTRSVRYGRTAGLVSMLGLEAGAALHAVLAAVGLAAMVASSPMAIEVIRWCGVAYLAVLGVRQLAEHGGPTSFVSDQAGTTGARAAGGGVDSGSAVSAGSAVTAVGGRGPGHITPGAPARGSPGVDLSFPRDEDRRQVVVSRRRLFAEGLLVDLLNPKTALFFVAFLPQFVQVESGPAGPQMLVLGLCFVLLAGMCDSAYVAVAGSLADRMNRSDRTNAVMRTATAGIYLGLAAVTALS